MNSRQVLIVDDEEQTCFCLSLALKMKGYKTDIARDGAQALQIITDRRESAEPVDLMV